LEALTDNNVLITPGQLGPVQLIDRSTGLPYNPTRWKVTTKDGTAYVIDDDAGLQSVTDRNGNVTSLTDEGITNSSGLGMSISRDGLGRITGITDPLSNTLSYQYDAYGDLVA